MTRVVDRVVGRTSAARGGLLRHAWDHEDDDDDDPHRANLVLPRPPARRTSPPAGTAASATTTTVTRASPTRRGTVTTADNHHKTTINSATIATSTDPWSDATWGENALNATFETVETDVFAFATADDDDDDDSARPPLVFHDNDDNDEASPHLQTPQDVEFSLFRGAGAARTTHRKQRTAAALSPPSSAAPATRTPAPIVAVALHEHLATTYDDVSAEPQCQLEGTIHVQAATDLSQHPFDVVLRDAAQHIDVCLPDRKVCQRIVPTTTGTTTAHSSSDRVVLRVSLPPTAVRQSIAVARYICAPTVRPVPLLVKSRVQSAGAYSRVGFKIRANPTNQGPLHLLVIMLAVPPHVNGRSGKLSRKGGMWDELKRTVSWTVPEMVPGQALEIQAQFETLHGGSSNHGEDSPTTAVPAPRFPILVRCECAHRALSGVVVLSQHDHPDAFAQPVQLQVEHSARILHRKV